LGKEQGQAEAKYADLVGTVKVRSIAEPREVAQVVSASGSVTVRQAASALTEYNVSRHPDNAKRTRTWSAACLKPVVDRWGDLPISSLTPQHVQQLQLEVAAVRSPKTCNDYISATVRMVKYAVFKGWRSTMETSFIRPMPKPSPKPKHYSVEDLQSMLTLAKNKKYRAGYDQQRGLVYAAIKLQLLTAARPSEVVTLLNGNYVKVEEGVYMLNSSKTDKSSKYPRHLVLCKEAQECLRLCQGAWPTPMAYLLAVKRTTKKVPHNLRHTGAYFLHRMPNRASREQTDILLGHYPGSVSLTYNPIHWEEYLEIAERYAQHLSTLMPQHFGR